MIAWQRQIRERQAEQECLENLFGAYWLDIDAEFGNAAVREIDYQTAKGVIETYEWLGNMGTTEYAFGLFFQDVIAGVACFGRTAGTNVYTSIAGAEYAGKAITLCRGACVHWAHPHSASYLINRACRLMVEKGYRIFVAYSDPEAGEVGTVYQASSWLYCGMTAPTEKFRAPDGKVRDARLVSAYTRDRRGGKLRYKRTRAEQKRLMEAAGYAFFPGTAKGRYLAIYGTSGERKRIRSALQWPVLPYPKRAVEGSRESREESIFEGEGQFLDTAP